MSERNTMKVRIYSPQGTIYEHRAYGCNVQSVEGGVTLLPNHAPILVALQVSAVRVTRCEAGDPQDYIAINGGILEMRDNVCEIMTNFAIRARDIDEARVLTEKQQAESDMQSAMACHDEQAFKRAKIALDRAVNMISVSKHRR
ncbi:MAG: ATP synthase F1 subunit epsilon [Aerococcaceae bacterium]|nr:ATP synthase F1 subunit epsilon [Aerococcaceae bacterium]